jgi:hypothetical protein
VAESSIKQIVYSVCLVEEKYSSNSSRKGGDKMRDKVMGTVFVPNEKVGEYLVKVFPNLQFRCGGGPYDDILATGLIGDLGPHESDALARREALRVREWVVRWLG